MKFNYICSCCGREYDITPQVMLCPACAQAQVEGQPLAGVLEVKLSGSVRTGFDPFELLPVEKQYFPPAPVGGTPLWQPRNLREEFGFASLYLKDDGANPTFSFKDRASFLVSAFAKKHGIKEIVVASTGNAGSSMSGIGAAAGQRITLFLPKAAPKAKLVQALQYGAKVYRVDGPYDLAYQLSLEYSRAYGGMNRNTAYNPMTLEGKKTVSLELYNQLGRVPDHVFVSTGDGCILSGVYKGFRDLVQLGLAEKIPTIHSVQAENSDALFRAFRSGVFEKRPSHTVADSICVEVPANGAHALSQLKTHDGRMVRVSDEEILRAQRKLASGAGLFSEPAGAAAFAGFVKSAGELPKDDLVVVLATGSGLKDISSARQAVDIPEKAIRGINEI